MYHETYHNVYNRTEIEIYFEGYSYIVSGLLFHTSVRLVFDHESGAIDR